MTHFPRHCMVEGEWGSCHDDQDFQMAGSEAVVGAHVAPCSGPNARSRCLTGHGCGPSAAHPSSSSPWPLAGNGHHNHPAYPSHHRQGDDLLPDPLNHHGCGCACLGDRHNLLLSGDHQGSSRGACGRHGRSHCERCCSIRRPS